MVAEPDVGAVANPYSLGLLHCAFIVKDKRTSNKKV
jgi:hypothetical protein